MDVKNKVSLEVKVNDRIYSLECYSDSPLGEAFDAVNQIRAYIIDKINESAKEAQPKEAVPEAAVSEAQPQE
jgi:hypothetical protein